MHGGDPRSAAPAQAYRRLALVKHPDKQKHNPNAGGVWPPELYYLQCVDCAVGPSSCDPTHLQTSAMLSRTPAHAPSPALLCQAASEFDELQKAYAVLTDKDARGALDDYIR
jgi:curved DNA-binding protein CbpA